MRHVSERAARRPGHDLPSVLWEADPVLGRRAYHWVGRLAPDERPPDLKPRHDYSSSELRLEEIVAAIPNGCGWDEWNRIGMAIFAASGGSELGFVAFDDFSSRSPKYDPHAVLERWRNYRRSPPSRISLGTLIHHAREAGWRRSAA
jgi:Primase C terminal 2 (PriCT-2)